MQTLEQKQSKTHGTIVGTTKHLIVPNSWRGSSSLDRLAMLMVINRHVRVLAHAQPYDYVCVCVTLDGQVCCCLCISFSLSISLFLSTRFVRRVCVASVVLT